MDDKDFFQKKLSGELKYIFGETEKSITDLQVSFHRMTLTKRPKIPLTSTHILSTNLC